MRHHWRYMLGAIASIPLLPIIHYQGKKIRREVPQLPEALEPSGYVDTKSEKTITILFIGESTIAGVGVKKHKEGFAGAFAKNMADIYDVNVQWSVYARSGYTAKKMQERLLPKIKEEKAELIVLGMGANDAFTLNNPIHWNRDAKNLLLALQDKFGSTPIACPNIPPIKMFPAFTRSIKFVIGNLGEILGDELAQLCSTLDRVYFNSTRIDLNTWRKHLDIEPTDGLLFSDGVHPSELTYQIWAQDFAEYVERENVFKYSPS